MTYTIDQCIAENARLSAELAEERMSRQEWYEKWKSVTDELAELKAEVSAPWHVGAFIDVDGFKVGPHMVREYRAELAELKAAKP
jgi:hypothetical protein